MGKHALVAFVFFYCVAAFAAGDNTHGQGVRFAGRGFDEQTALQPSQGVPYFSNADWPLKSRTYNWIGGGSQIRVDAQCPRDPVPDPLFALCYGAVYDASGKPIPACDPTPTQRSGRRAGAAAAPRENVPLLAIRGKWNPTPGVFVQDNEVVTFACAPAIKPKPQWLHEIKPFTGDLTDPRETNLDTSEGLGVLAKCYFWGFAGVGQARKSDTSRLATYQACLRAARAEYCGGGLSQTELGTIIQVYEPKETQAVPPTVTLDSNYCKQDQIKNPKSNKPVKEKQVLEFQPCFEALWDTEKALCVSHSRYQDMPAPDCQTHFQKEFKAVFDGDQVIIVKANPGDKIYLNCQIDDYQMVVRNALVKNRSGINKLKGKPVTSCTNDIPCP
jgi:hypothetical protein